jgi:hypothetical protein
MYQAKKPINARGMRVFPPLERLWRIQGLRVTLMTSPIALQRIPQVTRDVRWLDRFDCNLSFAQIGEEFSADQSALLNRLARISFPVQVFFQSRQPRLVSRFFEWQCAPPLVTTKDCTHHLNYAKEMGLCYEEFGRFSPFLRIIQPFPLPIEILINKFSHTRFEPSGWTTGKEIGYAKRLMDYVFRWLALKFLPTSSPSPTGAAGSDPAPAPAFLSGDGLEHGESDAPACKECGSIMSRNGSCYRCGNCGWTSGCS